MTGLACAKELNAFGAKSVVVTDTRTGEKLKKLAGEIEKVKAAGADFMDSADAAKLKPDFAVVSPGVAVAHKLVRGFADAGAEIIGEIELAYRLAEGMFIAITGTNGKTTVTGLIGEIMKSIRSDVRVTGNIGAPLIGAVAGSTADTVFVTEISSFQLETCTSFAPHISVILNVQPDHLERHGDMQGYAESKRRMIETQAAADFAVLNADDGYVSAMAPHTKAEVVFYSTRGGHVPGAYVRNGMLLVNVNGAENELMRASELPIMGEHNVGNVLAAASAAALAGAPKEKVVERIHSFEGFHFRIEKTAEKNGVLYINDSKGTNLDATLAAIRTFAPRPIVLILGGDDKKLDYSRLYEEVKRSVKRVVVLGPGLRRTAGELSDCGFASVETAGDMEQAVRAAASAAVPGDVVLLSPASSSFDLFRNYEERGERFNDAVRSL